MTHAIVDALSRSLSMGWEILWPLILGFALSAAVQAVVSHKEMGRLLPDDSLRSIAVAVGLGAASSSCSYAAVALARSLFRKGANFTAAMAFELASTNIVAELSVVMLVLLGWRFMLAEAIGAGFMIAIVVLLFRLFLPPGMVAEARAQADRGLSGRMEGHAEMDMAVADEGSILARLTSANGITATSHYFVMDWASVLVDVVLGLLIAGAISALVPDQLWQKLFLAQDSGIAVFWGPLIGPLIAVFSFVCSVGNIPLAAVLWNGGISFGGVIAFILADLIVLPVLDIYRKYYGRKMAAFLFVAFYAAMAAAAFIVDRIFAVSGLIPRERNAMVVEAAFTSNYTAWLNILFLVLATVLLWRFKITGGPAMLRMMSRPVPHGHHHCH